MYLELLQEEIEYEQDEQSDGQAEKVDASSEDIGSYGFTVTRVDSPKSTDN